MLWHLKTCLAGTRQLRPRLHPAEHLKNQQPAEPLKRLLRAVLLKPLRPAEQLKSRQPAALLKPPRPAELQTSDLRSGKGFGYPEPLFLGEKS